MPEVDRPGIASPIAVVGVGCRLPGGVGGLEDFRSLLTEGRSGVAEVPPQRWDVEEFYTADPELPGRSYARHGGFLADVDRFDAALFGVPADEATSIDPQHRLAMETAWEAFEHAGIAPDRMRGTRTGVFVGMGGSDYERLNVAAGTITQLGGYAATGSSSNFAANRVSYALGLEGPSMVVDTACSSSLVAVHLACQSLRLDECDTALAGGVNLLLSPDTTVALAKGRMLSPQGRCRAFDADADGYVRGEGAGLVVLRPLDAALRDGQEVLAVIRGSAVNQDGRSNGLTAPRGPAQQDVITRALTAAGVAPADVDYVEAHGTGTPLGDPIEIRALSAALGPRPDGRRVLVGSVKTNIGHLEAAAGIAGLLKALLVVRHGSVPRHLHLTRPNPYVDWDAMAVEVPTTTVELHGPRHVAGVSSFGFGGTNAHVVLESAPPSVTPAGRAEEPQAVVVKLSGTDRDAVGDVAGRLAAAIGTPDGPPLREIAYVSGVARADLPSRTAVVAESTAELRAALDAVQAGGDAPESVVRGRGGSGASVAFVVPGQGARLAGALHGIHGVDPVVTEAVDELAEVFGPVTEWPLRLLVEPGPAGEQARQTAVTQPALFTLAVALGRWWASVGVQPELAAGHSVGAYAAAVLAGVVGPADGARIIRDRARLMQDHAPTGAMAAVFADVSDVADAVAASSGAVSVAAVNGRRETVVSGDPATVSALVERWRGSGIAAVLLPVTRGFHSAGMDPVLEPLRAAFTDVELVEPAACLLVSDRTGAVAGPEVTTAEYWVRHAREPVLFGEVVRTLAEEGASIVVELGPGGMLPLVTAGSSEHPPVCVPTTGPGGRRALATAAARVWAAGAALDWDRVNGPRPPQLPRLPGYPFQRRSYWLPPRPTTADPALLPARTPEPAPTAVATDRAPARHFSARELTAVLRRELVEIMEHADPTQVGLDTGLFDLGLTSAMVATLRTRLEALLGRDIRPTVVFEHPTVRRLAEHLAADGAPTDTPRPVEPRPAPAGAEPIAVVGIGCRFPGGGNDPDAFWRLLRDGVDATGPAPTDRWDPAGTPPGGFLDQPVTDFDAESFGITPREARSMDPQQRLLLEVTWEALEDAGHPVSSVDGTATGIYVGINTADYLHLLDASADIDIDAYRATGNTFSAASGRLSYVLGAQGPSMAIDTACSSSLVGVHLALRSLRSGETDLALAGGVNLMLSPTTTQSMAQLGALSPDGRCKTFDAAADGYGRGEGCGVVVLKRLSDARAAGDRVYGVLRGSATNQDGRSAGLTVPNGTAQQDVVRAALRDAGVRAGDVDYVEAHGTGTPLGDPMELTSLAAVLRPDGPGAGAELAVGSVKTNIGHLEAAAGISGLIKVLLSLHHGELPAHLHLHDPSPQVPWAELAVSVPTVTAPWPSDGSVRTAGVSSFGFTGTNAHVIVEQAPDPMPVHPADGAATRGELLLISGRTADAATVAAERWAGWLAAQPDARWAALTRAAAHRRAHHPHRIAVVADSPAAAAHRLTRAGRGPSVHRGTSPPGGIRLVLAYSGQGSQWAGMGVGLLDEPVAADALRRCAAVVRREAGWSLLDEMCAASSRLDDTAFAQPAIVAAQVAQTELLRSWGVVPDAVLGHSVGEIGAAYGCGALDLETAMTVAVRRGAVMGSTRGLGAMAAVGAGPDTVRDLIAPYDGRIVVAAVNGPDATVVAGNHTDLVSVEAAARGRGYAWFVVQEQYAFHSPHMLGVRDELLARLDGIAPVAPQVPAFSTVTGTACGPDAFGAGYWAENLMSPVRFRDAVRAAGQGPHHTVVVELGARPVLGSAALSSLDGHAEDATALAAMRPGIAVRESALGVLATLHVLGRPVDLDAVYGPGPAGPMDLPLHPWQRTRHWLPDLPGGPTAPGRDDIYEVTWPEALAPAGPARGPAHWLVLGTDELADSVAEGLVGSGHRVTAIPAPDTVEPLVTAVTAAGPVSGIVHVAAGADPHDIDRALTDTCQPVLAAARLAGTAVGPVPVWIVTRGAAPVDHAVVPLQAPVWGLGRVLALEQPDAWGGMIDLDPAGNTSGTADAAQVVGELLSGDGEDQVAYRAGRRHVARLAPAAALPRPDEVPDLDAGAAYLVTGGRGALGLGLARWLAGRGARHLVLTGRRPHADDPTEVRAAVTALEADGVTVETPAVDVADRAAMERLLAAPRPPLHGVVHAAGMFEPAAVHETAWDRFRAVLRAKVEGTLVLDDLCADHPLDFLVLYSSASATWGSALSGHYVAGNYFLDVLAHDRARRGLPALAVDWGWFTGSDLVDADHTGYFEAMGLHGLSPEEGFATLDRLLAEGRTQVTVAPVDWPRFRGVLEAKRRRPLLELMDSGGTESAAAVDEELIGVLRGSSDTVRRRLLQERLQVVVNQVFGRAPDALLDPDTGFFDAGMDSLMSVELRSRVEGLLGLPLEATATFEHPSIAALSAHLSALFGSTTDVPAAEPATPIRQTSTHGLDALSEHDLMQLLGEELERNRA